MSKNSDKAILHLNLMREHFAKIAAGTKPVEYRDCTAYWRKRLEGRQYDIVQFRNGYATKAPVMQVKFRGVQIIGRGANKQYAIKLGKILKIQRWKP